MYPIISVECEDGCYPVRAHETDAGADLVCKENIVLVKNTRILVPTGVKVAIPKEFVGLLFPRSSLSKSNIIMTNSVGVIDSDYRGEIKASLLYTGANIVGSIADNFIDYTEIQKGTRIVQLVIVPIILPKFQIVDKLDETARGTGGFGSTGT